MNFKRCLPSSSLASCSPASHTHKHPPHPSTLFQTIQPLDTQLFEAYNPCDLKTLGAMVADDLEFCHDQTGLSIGKAPFLAGIQQNICGKVHRTLDQGSLEVYPLRNYGAVEIGVHSFSHPQHPEDGSGDAKFVTLWENKNGNWFVTRVISYDPNQPSPSK
jgi:hypothetical protein